MAKKSTPRYTSINSHGASSKWGQMIGNAFAAKVVNIIHDFLVKSDLNYELLKPEEGKNKIRLEMYGGTFRETDNVIVPVNSSDPVAIFESKWLKDARHHNDKGAWILQMREIKKKYPTIRGAVANVLGYWTEGIGLMIENEGKVRMVMIAKDEDVYRTLQPHLDQYLQKMGISPFRLDPKVIRQSMPEPWAIANCLLELEKNNLLEEIAEQWFNIIETDTQGNDHTGKDRMIQAIEDILKPLPSQLSVLKYDLTLEISTGNLVYLEFSDLEELQEFLEVTNSDPAKILELISPSKRKKEIKERPDSYTPRLLD